MVRRLFPAILLVSVALSSGSIGQSLEFIQVPDGFIPGSIQLPGNFGGGIGVDPNNPDRVFVSTGSYLNNQLARIDLKTKSLDIVAEGPFGNVAGIAVISATQLILIDNASAPGGPPDKTILLASDLNLDGDYNDPSEIEELIPPILTGFFGWSGAQAHVVPPGNPGGLQSGSVLVQTADGFGEGELLQIRNPLGLPAFFPPGAAFFSGLDYNGGFAFDQSGHLLVGSATVVDPTSFLIAGRVYGVLDVNRDGVIGDGESNIVVDTGQLPSGGSDLTIDGEDDVFLASGGSIYTFPAPADPLAEQANVAEFARTNSFFLSAAAINTRVRPFEPDSGTNGASLIIGGGFGEKNLLTLTPAGSADLDGDGLVNANDLFLFQEQWHSVTGP
ncbi:MAG: hypothetical protein HUU36_00525 [Candidatus Omnitrophica bacterium]|nr:hypothetical protein [Candidatus Omnitrophota bacterium]